MPHSKITPRQKPQPSQPDEIVSARDITWVDVTKLYRNPRECLASYLTIVAAEVLSGVKPANLIRISNRKLNCGRNLNQLWHLYGVELLQSSPLSAKVMRSEDAGELLLFYRPELLERRLRTRTMRTFLARQGYPTSLDLDEVLSHLQEGYRHGIPDEVGLFLGYPLRDVKGFMNKTAEPFQGRGLWRIYGPPQRSLQLYDAYRSARQRMVAELVRKQPPLPMLHAV